MGGRVQPPNASGLSHHPLLLGLLVTAPDRFPYRSPTPNTAARPDSHPSHPNSPGISSRGRRSGPCSAHTAGAVSSPSSSCPSPPWGLFLCSEHLPRCHSYSLGSNLTSIPRSHHTPDPVPPQPPTCRVLPFVRSTLLLGERAAYPLVCFLSAPAGTQAPPGYGCHLLCPLTYQTPLERSRSLERSRWSGSIHRRDGLVMNEPPPCPMCSQPICPTRHLPPEWWQGWRERGWSVVRPMAQCIGGFWLKWLGGLRTWSM